MTDTTIEEYDGIEDSVLEDRMGRLITLQGSDPGFFVLAGLSFIESYIREYYGVYDRDVSFKSLLWDEFFNDIKSISFNLYKDKSLLNRLLASKNMANGVRHSFNELCLEDVQNMTHNLSGFCTLANINHIQNLNGLVSTLDIWKEERSRVDLLRENQQLREASRISSERSEALNAELQILRQDKFLLDSAKKQLLEKERELERLQLSNDNRDDTYDKLRRERFQLKESVRKLTREVESHREVEEYIENILSDTLAIRTRWDYEQSLLDLTEEQKVILGKVGTGDFLILGGAGTGKTLVLIKALENFIQSQERELINEDHGKGILLTYNKTLVKYDRYIYSIMSDDNMVEVNTVDRFILDIGKTLIPQFRVNYDYKYDIPQELIAAIPPGLNVAKEIEDFILSRNITKEQYLGEMVLRTGRRISLKKPARLLVWDYFEKISSISEGAISRGLYVYKLLQKLDELDARGQKYLSGYKHIFIDEVQDLKLSSLLFLKEVASGGIIMAGDTDQAIYHPGFSFGKANIQIVGKTHYLTINFRNSKEINNLAESYRNCSDNLKKSRHPINAVRRGPSPELFKPLGIDKMEAQLLSRVKFFIETLHYDPSNIAILTPTKKVWSRVKSVLSKDGIPSEFIRKDDFDFKDADSIRLSTLHSGKGLDFPVVFLYLPQLPYVDYDWDTDAKDAMRRSMLYVSMTRAMDHLDIFIEKSKSEKYKCLADIVTQFDKLN